MCEEPPDMNAWTKGITPELLDGLKIVGEGIILRPVLPSDATPEYVSWLNNPETTRYMESGRRVETVMSIAKYIGRYQNREDALFMAIVLKNTGRHIGNIKLEPICWTHRKATVGIMIGAADARGRGLGTEAMVCLLRFAFVKLRLHRVALGVTADNSGAIRCYKKTGFLIEGHSREAIRRDNKYIDGVTMGILDHEFLARYGENSK